MKRALAAVLSTSSLVLGVASIGAGCGARTGLSTAPAAVDVDAIPCVPGTTSLTRAKPAVVFVLDRSRSMAQPLVVGTPATRWQVLRSALAAALPPIDGDVEIGALLYPASGGGGQTCAVGASVDLEPRTGNVGALSALLSAASPTGSTPTADAIEAAASVLLARRAATRARALVLATDGAPACNDALDPRTCRCAAGGARCQSAVRCLDDARSVERIRALATGGLPTYVIGLASAGDGTFAGVLDAMAVAGGRPRRGGTREYYAASSGEELEAALVEIRDQVGACTYLTTSVPSETGSITVTLDGVVLPQDPAGVEGWRWGSQRDGEILVSGATCERIRNDPAPALAADVACTLPDASR